MNRENVVVRHVGAHPSERERHRLSPVAERFLREYGEKITVINVGEEPEEQDVDEGRDGHLWIPGQQKKRSRIIVPVMVGFGEVKENSDG